MKTITAGAQRLKDKWQEWGRELLQTRFFQDKLTLSIMAPALALNVITILLLSFRLRPTDFDVPVRYSSLVGFDTLGPWYQIYGIGLFSLGVTLANLSLAYMSYHRSRITSFFLLLGSFAVSLFCLIISLAFTAIV